MQVPLEISYRGVEKTDTLDNLIREQIGKLEKVCNRITSCAVAVERPQQHQRFGRSFRVRLDLRVPPGHEVVARRESSEGDVHDALPAVIRETCEAARRQLRELMDRQRGEVKTHPEQQVIGFVTKLFPQEGYGILTSDDGREVYFHRNAVLHHDFDRLEIGTGVHFVEESGDEGPQASTVQLVEKKGHLPHSAANRPEK